jgi:peptidoglycan-associated lipoprotein
MVLAFATIGCRPKKPVTVAEAAAATPEPALSAAPETTASPEVPADPLAGTLDEVNDYVRRNGLLADVYFDFDRAELRPEARQRLLRNAEFLRQHPQFDVTIEGHCDERGTNDYNLALGERRASAAVRELVAHGVAAQALKSVSYGEEKAVCGTSDEACWQQNRRAHFVVSGRR